MFSGGIRRRGCPKQASAGAAQLSVSAIFLIHGVIVASWASRIPDFQAMLHPSPAILEGNAFEADVVVGVEDAGDHDGTEVHTREVPQDDVPNEYLDKK